jgi:uncharacterized membrane protein YcaP (DUF421 family)
VSRKHESQPTDPPPAPDPPRGFALRPLQIVGIAVLTLIPVLGALGVLGDGRAALDKIWRVVFVYFFLMIAFRFAGKRELSELSPFELVTLLMIPEIYSSALNSNDNSLSHATISVATLFVLVFATGLVTFRSRRAERLIEGEPTVLVRQGNYLEDALKRERISPEEVMSEMHKVGIADIREVEWAILEVDGRISIIPHRLLPPS